MDLLKKLFPFSLHTRTSGELVLKAAIYMFGCTLAAYAAGMLAPVSALLAKALEIFCYVYCIAGILLAVVLYLRFAKEHRR